MSGAGECRDQYDTLLDEQAESRTNNCEVHPIGETCPPERQSRRT